MSKKKVKVGNLTLGGRADTQTVDAEYPCG